MDAGGASADEDVELKAPNEGADNCAEFDENDINDCEKDEEPTLVCAGGGDKRVGPFEGVGRVEFIHSRDCMEDATFVLSCESLVEDTSPNKSISKEFAGRKWLAPDNFIW